MRKFTFTLYKSGKDVKSKIEKKSWKEWISVFSTHSIRGKSTDTSSKYLLKKHKDGPLVVLGPVRGNRSDSNVEHAEAIGIDIDGVPENQAVRALAPLAPFEYVLYTTHRHGAEASGPNPRVRVVVPFDKPISPPDYPEVWKALDRLTGHVNDPQTKNIGRMHYLPSTFDSRLARALHNPGRFISIDDLPPADADSAPDDIESAVQLEKIQNAYKSVRKEDPVKESLTFLMNQQAFAEPGERHRTVLQLTLWLARIDDSLSTSSLKRLFGPSLEVMRAISSDSPTLQEVETAYQGAVEKNRAYLVKQQIKRGSPGAEPYTDEDLERIASKQGWKPEDLQERWVVQKDGSAWLLNREGVYVGPYSKDDLSLASKILAPAPVRLVEFTKSGFKYRSIQDVFREVGSLADCVVTDMTEQFSRFDPAAGIMYDASTPIRADLNPKFDDEIDAWLHLLFGTLYEKGVDWVSCCSDLTKLLCAVYFDGPKGSGKTLFAHGLAKLWTEGGPGELEQVLSGFNDEIVRSPLLLADEEIPVRFGRQTVTTTLRSMLSTTQRTLKQKYKPTSDLRGAIRLILTANNAFLLDSSGVSSAQDLDAIAQRFLYVPVGEASTIFLDKLSRETKNEWMEKGIAEHALWLAENHEIKEVGKRFWVEGDVSEMHRMLMSGSRWNSFVCEWLVKYLMSPQTFDSQGTGLIRRQNGELLVNDQAIVDKWELYMHLKILPETAKIGSALRAIAKSKDRKQLRWQGKHIRYRIIDVEHLVEWSNRYNIGDKETMENVLIQPVSVEKMAIPEKKEQVEYDENGKLKY